MRQLKVLLSVVGLCAFSGCYDVPERQGELIPAPGMEKTIAVLPYAGDTPFWQQFQEGASEAAKAQGYRIHWEAPPPVWNPRRQDEIMRTLTELAPPGIVVGPLHRNLLQDSLIDAVKMGLPVVLAGSNEDTASKLAYVGSDNVKMGTELAQWVGKLTPPQSTVAVMDIQHGMRSVDLRRHALQEKLSGSFPALQVQSVPFHPGNELNFIASNLQKIMSQSLKAYLQENHQIGSIVALDGNSTIAAWHVLQQLPSAKRPLLFGVSVDPDLVKASKQGDIAALAVQDPDKMGELSVEAIIAFIAGRRPASKITVPYQMYHVAP